MDFYDIINEYKFKTETHAHSNPVSACGKFPADEVVQIYLGTDCNTLTITNHLTPKYLINRTPDELAEYYLSDYYKACEAAKGTSLNVALGVEIRFEQSANDYLVYGVCPDDIEKMISLVSTDIETFYKEFKNDRNVILHAHPFRSNMDPTPIGSVDGIETFNCHPGHNSKIAFACRLAREHGLLVSGGSDFHESGRHATCLMRTKRELKDSYDIADAIKSRDIIFDVFGHVVIPYLY